MKLSFSFLLLAVGLAFAAAAAAQEALPGEGHFSLPVCRQHVAVCMVMVHNEMSPCTCCVTALVYIRNMGYTNIL